MVRDGAVPPAKEWTKFGNDIYREGPTMELSRSVHQERLFIVTASISSTSLLLLPSSCAALPDFVS